MFHPQTLLRSAGVRFGLIYAGLFALSAVALTAFLWWSTAGLLDRQTETAINADAQGLVERFLDGPNALVETIQDRLAANVDDDAIYLLADSTLRPIAGNLDRVAEDGHRATSNGRKSRSTAPACGGWRASASSCCPAATTCWSGATCRRARNCAASWVMR